VSRNIFLILSGGPGIYNPKDKEHDQSWDNYVTPALLRTYRDKAALHDIKTEDVHWLIYEPAYKDRWNSDLKSKHSAPHQYQSTQKIIKDGFKNYLEKLKKPGLQHIEWAGLRRRDGAHG
jgi:hypothetical protein